MTVDDKPTEGLSLKRWSQRKFAAARAKDAAAASASPVATPVPVAAPSAVESAQPAAASAPVATLPHVESLTIDSDFTPFFQSKVDEALKRQALKQLLRDPRFNVMDGLDVYVDDYSIPDPISPDIVKQMVQGRYIFDPPATRINAQGHAEDVPPEEAVLVDPAVSLATDEALTPSKAGGDATEAPPKASTAEAPAAAALTPPAPRDSVAAPVMPSDAELPGPPAR